MGTRLSIVEKIEAIVHYFHANMLKKPRISQEEVAEVHEDSQDAGDGDDEFEFEQADTSQISDFSANFELHIAIELGTPSSNWLATPLAIPYISQGNI